MRYMQAYDGEWVHPRKRNYYLRCCDCGLVHRINFRVNHCRAHGHDISFQPVRLRKAAKRKAAK